MPEDRPRIGERCSCPLTEGLGKERNRSNSGDSLRWQTNLFGLATDDSKIERP